MVALREGAKGGGGGGTGSASVGLYMKGMLRGYA